MADSHFEYAVKNQLDLTVGGPTNNLEDAQRWRDQNQQIAMRVGDHYSRYRVVKRRVTVGQWIDVKEK